MDRFLRLRSAVLIGGFALVLSQAPARVLLAEPSTAENVNISSLIVDLDSDNYDVRNAATERLIAIGRLCPA